MLIYILVQVDDESRLPITNPVLTDHGLIIDSGKVRCWSTTFEIQIDISTSANVTSAMSASAVASPRLSQWALVQDMIAS